MPILTWVLMTNKKGTCHYKGAVASCCCSSHCLSGHCVIC